MSLRRNAFENTIYFITSPHSAQFHWSIQYNTLANLSIVSDIHLKSSKIFLLQIANMQVWSEDSIKLQRFLSNEYALLLLKLKKKLHTKNNAVVFNHFPDVLSNIFSMQGTKKFVAFHTYHQFMHYVFKWHFNEVFLNCIIVPTRRH